MKNDCLPSRLLKSLRYLMCAAIAVLLVSASNIQPKNINGTWRLLKTENNGIKVPPILTDRIIQYEENGTFEGKIFQPEGVRKYNSGKYYLLDDSTMVTFNDDIAGNLSKIAYTYNFNITNDTLHFYGYYLREAPNNKLLLMKIYLDEWWVKEPLTE